jgi:hypothetical protein
MGRLEGLVAVGICSTFDIGDVTICLGTQETKVLVRSLGGLEDGKLALGECEFVGQSLQLPAPAVPFHFPATHAQHAPPSSPE